MPNAVNLIRSSLHYRREAFTSGLLACGYRLVETIKAPTPEDVLLIWNRYSGFAEMADFWESRGARVIVAENGYLGKHWRGGEWFSLALGHHCGSGYWVDQGPSRWDGWSVDLAAWKYGEGNLILAQRGIGERGIASPMNWAESAVRRYGGRIRPHPGKTPPKVTLEEDLGGVDAVLTWNSAAALRALLLGYPVWFDDATWIGGLAARPLKDWPGEAKRSDVDRLQMFRRLAWSVWNLQEVQSGEAFSSILRT